MKRSWFLLVFMLAACGPRVPKERLLEALNNGSAARNALEHSDRYVRGWLAEADPESGLLPRNLQKHRDVWNGRDAAADNYPFMVLTTWFTDEALFNGRMKDMLATEARLTARHDRLPDDYCFSRDGWWRKEFDLLESIFDGAEYAKDGLMPITEWLGPSPWSDRMTGLVDDIWKNATIDTPFGRIPSTNLEVNGDLLQVCSRLFWFTGDRKYLDWGMRLGDYYLLGTNHLTRGTNDLALSDHACEAINGLSELYLACAHAAPEKRDAYRAPLHEMYDRILTVGRNEHGLLYTLFNTGTGRHLDKLTDNWGYNYDGVYTTYLVDSNADYRAAARKPLEHLDAHYRGYPWQGGGMDGYADSIEGAITLYNREPVPAAARWIDAEIRTLWSKQQTNGIIEGWHADGNFARTSLMYALWKSQGTWIKPWRRDVICGAVRDGEDLLIGLKAKTNWTGRLFFDRPRHREFLHLPVDYPRINQFPEWFTVETNASYHVTRNGRTERLEGAALRAGLEIRLEPDQRTPVIVRRAR